MRYLKIFESFVKELVAPQTKKGPIEIKMGKAPMLNKKYYFE
jgi:hypothetical protein